MIATITPYTPGPWSVADAPTLQTGDCQLTHQVWGRKRICFIEGQNVGLTVAAANAQLIAAAPDLLSVIKKLRHAVNALDLDPVDAEYCSILEQADLAIAKAEGR